MLSVLDEMRAEAIRRASSEESRRKIISRLLDEHFDWNALRFRAYREDSVHKQMVLRGRHPDFPDLAALYERDRQLRNELSFYAEMLRRSPYGSNAVHVSMGEHVQFSRRQRAIELERSEIKVKVRTVKMEILGPAYPEEAIKVRNLYNEARRRSRQGPGYSEPTAVYTLALDKYYSGVSEHLASRSRGFRFAEPWRSA